MRAFGICAALSALAVGGCGTGTVTVSDTAHPPRTAAERAAVDAVRAYDLAIRRDDAAAACRSVGGAELDAFRCRTRPSIPADRRSRLADPADLRVSMNDSPTGWIFLSGAAAGRDIGLHYKVSRARGAQRVTRVDVGVTR
ncbi:hypothetical protein OJ997_02910 [Solirubrobacter phytolaccae]|uniref:Uncharacterized protein n=1 Tax=Solirubrobacter phytolaccae TaxID=1404360 RepID=A0A9X3N411_9ACTN|nr:hypothetical protein [Solirubrobacter phytolaccae]MDA0179234.1 hypothetical protein [Solirubrobacter phytolaccae]